MTSAYACIEAIVCLGVPGPEVGSGISAIVAGLSFFVWRYFR